MVLTLRTFALLAFLAAAALIAFGWWGMFTEAGDAAYPEMQSYIPFFWGLVGVVMLAASLALFAIASLCRRMERRAQERSMNDATVLERAA